MAKVKVTSRLTPMGVRRNAVKRFTVISKTEAKLVDKIASYNKDLSKKSDGSLYTSAY